MDRLDDPEEDVRDTGLKTPVLSNGEMAGRLSPDEEARDTGVEEEERGIEPAARR